MWLDRLAEAGVPVGPAYDLPSALQDPLVKERNLVVEYPHDRLGLVRLIRSSVDVGGERTTIHSAPQLGADSRAILRDLAELSDDEIDRLEQAGVISPARIAVSDSHAP